MQLVYPDFRKQGILHNWIFRNLLINPDFDTELALAIIVTLPLNGVFPRVHTMWIFN